MPIDSFILYFIGLSRAKKRLISVLVDSVLLIAVFSFALYIRLFDDFLANWLNYIWLVLAAPLISIPVFIRFGLYRAVLRYIGREAFVTIFNAVTLSALLLSLVVFLMSRSSTLLVPRLSVINFWLMGLLAIGGVRYFARQVFVKGVLPFPFTRRQRIERLNTHTTPVVIYGAGTAGYQLYEALRYRANYRPVAFVDDDHSLHRQAIAGLKVYGPQHIEEMVKETGAKELLLAIPSISRRRRGELLDLLAPYPLHVRTVPSVEELASGRLKVDDIGEVDLTDLLHREEVPPQSALLSRCILGKTVMVTGAGGSIGAELCKQIAKLDPAKLILIEHSEFNLYASHDSLMQQLRVQKSSFPLVPILCSIKNTAQLLTVMEAYEVDTVYHAAAYKHVPIVEHNIAEGINNNVMGTLSVAQAAIAAGVSNFVLISTDKAVRPTNIMGASKRLAEMVLQALSMSEKVSFFNADQFLPSELANQPACNQTRFTMVRFGNVLGSSGSVIPKFREQIQAGGPVTVTHPKITRYFMTIPEAAQLVIQAGSMGQGGDVFVLDMGEPVRILDLAAKMIHLSGYTVEDESNPDGDIAIEFTGLRPGEKLYEELLIGDNVSGTDHAMIMRAQEECIGWEEMTEVLVRLNEDLASVHYGGVRETLARYVKGYQPQGAIVDWLHSVSKAPTGDRDKTEVNVIDMHDVAKQRIIS